MCVPEVAGDTFSDYTHVTKFLNLNLKFFQMWESYSCAKSASHQCNWNSQCL